MPILRKLPGLLAVTIVLIISWFSASLLPGGLVLHALLGGFLCGQVFGIHSRLKDGFIYGEKFLLSLAIALMGLGLSMGQVSALGWSSLIILLISISTAFLVAKLLGKRSGLSQGLVTLSAIGNAICGASAIVAAAPVIKARDEDVGLAIALVNGLGSLWMFLFPVLLVTISFFNTEGAAQLIGSTLQALGHVSGAGFSVSDQVGQLAVTLKLGRVALLGPLVLILGLLMRDRTKLSFPLPWFIIVFFLLVILRSTTDLPAELLSSVGLIAKWLLAMGMGCIGWQIQWAVIRESSGKALQLNLFISLAQIFVVILTIMLLQSL